MTLIAEKQSWGTRPWTGDSDGKRSQQRKVVYSVWWLLIQTLYWFTSAHELALITSLGGYYWSLTSSECSLSVQYQLPSVCHRILPFTNFFMFKDEFCLNLKSITTQQSKPHTNNLILRPFFTTKINSDCWVEATRASHQQVGQPSDFSSQMK